MNLACPGPDLARDVLVIARKTLEVTTEALEAVGRIEALAREGGDSPPGEIIIAAGAARALRPALEARWFSMQLLLAAAGRTAGDDGPGPAAAAVKPARGRLRPVPQLV
jgi:hypothetical protein